MDPELNDLLLGASTTAISEFELTYESSVYAELSEEAVEPTGFKKYFAQAKNGRFERFRGQMDFSGVTERDYSIITDVFKFGREIQRAKWDQLMAYLRANLPAMMSDAAAEEMALRDELYTKLLDTAVAGGTVPNLYSDTTFFGAVQMPGSGNPVVTNNNRINGGVLDATNLRAALYRAKERLSQFAFSNGRKYFNPGMIQGDLRIMYPTTQKMMQLIDENIDTGQVTASQTVPRLRGYQIRPNSLFDDQAYSNLNGHGANAAGGILVYRPVTNRLKLLQTVRRREGVQIETNLPPNQAAADSVFATEGVIERERYIFAARTEIEAGYGSPLQAVWIDFTNIR
ncbi:MAG: hypothetical protein IT464_12765 [Planctomycetes bacterium]|nr:hypothetical protein [Planctomycetota bacterium]